MIGGKLKILVITKWMIKNNGASRVVYELSKRFKMDHEIRIAVYKDYLDPEWEDEFKIHKLQNKGLFAFTEIRKIIKEYQPDVIHSHDWLGLLALLSNTPQLATNHSNWPMNWFLSMKDFVGGLIQEIPHEIKLHCVNKVVSISSYQYRKLKKRGISSEMIYNGVASDYFELPKKQIKMIHPAVLFVGNVDNRKAKYLVPFIKSLNQKNKKVHIYIIGAPIHKKIIEKLDNFQNTHYLGIINDVKPYYYEADALIFISKVEACPLVPIESQACGLPVVAFDVCSNRELIKNEYSGFLIELGDVNAAVNKILLMLENSTLLNKMSINSIDNVKKFNWDMKAQEYLKELEKISDKI